MKVIKAIKAFGRFWYDFVIGDDWKIAAAVVLALALLVAAMKAELFGDHVLAVLGGAGIVICFAASLVIDVRRASRASSRAHRHAG
jgi:hypothetical protein